MFQDIFINENLLIVIFSLIIGLLLLGVLTKLGKVEKNGYLFLTISTSLLLVGIIIERAVILNTEISIQEKENLIYFENAFSNKSNLTKIKNNKFIWIKKCKVKEKENLKNTWKQIIEDNSVKKYEYQYLMKQIVLLQKKQNEIIDIDEKFKKILNKKG